MIKQLKIVIILSCTLTLGCKKDVITNIDIRTQGDIDYYCCNLTDSDTFVGNVLISPKEELDYSCLDKIKHIKGALILDGPGSSKAFNNIETITMSDVFAICDIEADTMSFPNLRVIDTGLSIFSGCEFNNVLHIPNVEKLGSISIASTLFDEARSGTLLGFDKIEEIYKIWIDCNNGLTDNLTIDGFRNLKRVSGEFAYRKFNENLKIAENSFNKLEQVGKIWFTERYDSKSNFSLEYIFPELNSCENMILDNFDNDEACYLKDYIVSGDIKINVRNFITNEIFVNEALLDLCE